MVSEFKFMLNMCSCHVHLECLTGCTTAGCAWNAAGDTVICTACTADYAHKNDNSGCVGQYDNY